MCCGSKLHLKKCIEVATANNPAYQKTFLTAEVAATNVDQAKARRLPQTQFSVSQGMNFGRSIDRFSNDYINQMYNSTYSGLQVSVPVFKGFQRQFLVESSKFLEEAENSILILKNRLTLNILKAYLEVLATKEMVQVAENSFRIPEPNTIVKRNSCRPASPENSSRCNLPIR